MKLNYYLLLFIALFYRNIEAAGFLPNETVHLGDSINEIQNLNVSDNIVSFDGEKLVIDKVIKNKVKISDRGIKVFFEDATLTVPPDQLLFLPKVNQWVAAKDLKTNDLALSISGAWIPIIKTEEFKKNTKFHDLTIQNQHNFFVTKLGILVHNEPVSLAFGLVTTSQIGAAAISAAATSALAYLGYVELSAGNKTSNSPFPAISGCYTPEEKAQSQRTEQAAKQRATPNKKAQATNAKKQKQPAKASPAAKPVQKKDAAVVSKAPGDKGVEETKKAEDSAGVKDKAADSEKPADGEEAKEEEENKSKDPEKKLTDDEIKKALEDLTSKANRGEKKSAQLSENPTGDISKDFDSIPFDAGVKEKDTPKGKVRVGEFSNGVKVIERHSTEGRRTIEIQKPNGRSADKIRYGNK